MSIKCVKGTPSAPLTQALAAQDQWTQLYQNRFNVFQLYMIYPCLIPAVNDFGSITYDSTRCINNFRSNY